MKTVSCGTRNERLVFVSLITTLTMACSDPIAPGLIERKDLSDGQLTITDEVNGAQYTLDVPNQQILVSDGQILQLDGDQTAAASVAFRQTIETDPIDADLRALKSTCVEIGTPGCGASSNLSLPFAANRVADNAFASNQGKTHSFLWRRLGRVNANSRKIPSSGPAMASLATLARSSIFSDMAPRFDIGGDDICSSLLQVMGDSYLEYHASRTSFVHDVLPIAVAEGANEYYKKLVPGGVAAAKFEAEIAAHANASIKRGIIAWYWNTYSCGRSAVHGPVYLKGANPGGINTYTCHYEQWEVSFDDGLTWWKGPVLVCEST